jgi:aspartate carbamoyltransferase catalytic subunit
MPQKITQTWEKFSSLPVVKKLPYFRKNNRLFDCLVSQQFDRQLLEHLFNVATKIRSVARKKKGADWLQTLLSDKRAMLYFVQPSTRTFLSFQNACYILGMKVSEIRSTATSSEIKGESALDTVRTFTSYSDLLIMRHPEEMLAEQAAWYLNQTERPIPIINGGSGKNQHPTQALLDVYTLHNAFHKNGGIDNKTIALIGDLKRGRTVRSLTYLLGNYRNVVLTYVSPDSLKIGSDIKNFLKENKLKFSESNSLQGSVKEADAVYMTRIQDEYDTHDESRSIDYTQFYLKKEHLKLLKRNAVIMHPLPRRREIDPVIDSDPRATYWRQERNGMWIRSALIAYLFAIDKLILKY